MPTTSTRPVAPKANPRNVSSGFVTHGDLLRLARRQRCQGIVTEPVFRLCRPDKNFWVFKATVYKTSRCRGFVGYGDAHPGNVSPLIFNHAEMRMAETRAVNRALRKAYGIALCSLEELPPWRLRPDQLPVLRRTLLTRPPFQKGVAHANQNPRSQSGQRKNLAARRSVPSASGYGTDKTALIRNWCAERSRSHGHFTPTYGSWINLVERWFAEITNQRIRRGVFRSMQELETAIRDVRRGCWLPRAHGLCWQNARTGGRLTAKCIENPFMIK